MSFRWIAAILLMLPLFAWHAPEARAQGGYDTYANEGYGQDGDVDDVSVFYDSLAPHGDWYYTPEYGYVWIPTVAYNDWRPYQNDGHWVWSDYGWMWVSDYDWGWAAFHYGRWIWLDSVWAWIPDVVWGPAWVAWRYSDAYVGWAPLPPGAYWYPDYGLDVNFTISYNYWTFVPGRYVLDRHVYRYAVPRGQTNRIYYGSRSATVYRSHNGMPVCVGVDVRTVSRWTGTPVRQVNVSVSTNVGRSVVRGGSVTIYRPPAASVSVRRSVAPPPARRQAPATLYRVPAPPPPARGNVAPSQNYRGRATYQQKAYAPPPPAGSQPRRSVERAPEVQQQKREVQQERRETQQDRRELQQDKQQLRQDVRTQPDNAEQIRRDRDEVQRSRQELNEQRRETSKEQRELQRERNEERREQRERTR